MAISLPNWSGAISLANNAVITLLAVALAAEPLFAKKKAPAPAAAPQTAPVTTAPPAKAAAEPAKTTDAATAPGAPAATTPAASNQTVNHDALLLRIREALKFGNSQQVRDALNTLTRLNTAEQKSLLPELKKTCTSPDPLVLRKMAEFIGGAPFNDLDEELTRFLGDKNNDQLYFSTVGALAKKKPASALPAIIKEIKEQDFSKPGNRLPDAVHLLTIYKDSSLQPFLMEKLNAADTYADYRSGILKYLGETKPWSETTKSQVLKLYKDEAEPLTVRGSAAYALGKAEISEAKPILKETLTKIEALKSSDEKKRYTRFRMQIIASLILLKDNEVREILYAMARDDDELVRVRAIHQIGQLKIAESRELLEYKSKFDPSMKVQKEAKKALALLDGDKSAPASTPDTEKEK